MPTLSDLLVDLKGHDPEKSLIFATKEGEIRPGYHVTELRHSVSTGIDCGGHIERWQDAKLQLLDGQGGTHMSVGKFKKIVERSLAALPELKDVPLRVEFGHNNAKLTLMSLSAPEDARGNVLIRLGEARAVCKPAQQKSEIGNGQDVCCQTQDISTSANNMCCEPPSQNTCCA